MTDHIHLLAQNIIVKPVIFLDMEGFSLFGEKMPTLVRVITTSDKIRHRPIPGGVAINISDIQDKIELLAESLYFLTQLHGSFELGGGIDVFVDGKKVIEAPLGSTLYRVKELCDALEILPVGKEEQRIYTSAQDYWLVARDSTLLNVVVGDYARGYKYAYQWPIEKITEQLRKARNEVYELMDSLIKALVYFKDPVIGPEDIKPFFGFAI